MGFLEAGEEWMQGIFIVFILLVILSAMVPLAQNTIASADSGVFGMPALSQTMLGLIGLIAVIGLLWSGFKKLQDKDDRSRIDFGG